MTKWMTMREFLRGGYKSLDDITIVSNHGRPVFTVHPHAGGVASPPADVAYVPPQERSFVPVPKPSAQKRTRRT